jgi:uncharacterized protein (DUF2062 family)
MDPGVETFITFAACILAAAAVGVVIYLAWKRFGPHRRHRRRSRRHRHFGQ